MATQPNQVTALPTPPSRLDPPDTFIANADAFLKALPNFGTELNTLQTDVSTKAGTVSTQAQTASDAASNAVAAANSAAAAATAAAWVSGRAYTVNQCAISPSNFQTYRRTVAGSGTTDPASDLTNWTLLFGNDANGAFIPYVMPATTIDLSKGNYFTRTTSGADTFTITNCPSPGYSFTLEVTMTSGSISFPASVKTPGDVVTTLATGKTHLFMFVTSNSGTRWRLTTAPNYTT